MKNRFVITVAIFSILCLSVPAYASEVGHIIDAIEDFVKSALLIIVGVVVGIYTLVKIIEWLANTIGQYKKL